MSAVGAGHACDSNIPNTITPAIPHQGCLITLGVCRLFADVRPWSQAWPAPTKAHSPCALSPGKQPPPRALSPGKQQPCNPRGLNWKRCAETTKPARPVLLFRYCLSNIDDT